MSLPWGLGRVNLCCVVDRPQRHPLLGDSEVDPTFLCGFSLGWSGKLGEPLSVDSLSSDCGSFHCCSCKGGSGTFFLAGALCLSAGHHLRLTRGPAGNRTTTGSLSASSRTTPHQLSHEDTLKGVRYTSLAGC